jgi:hypothetical protein
VADQEKENPDNDAGANLFGGGAKPFRKSPYQKNGPGGEVTKAGCVKRRNRFHSVANAKVGRTPNEVDAEERGKSQRRRFCRDKTFRG